MFAITASVCEIVLRPLVIASVSASIGISRKNHRWIDRARAYTVVIDGRESGRVRNGESCTFEVAPGRHQVYLKVDWVRSQQVEIELPEDGHRAMRCWSNAHPFTALYWISFGRSRYIGLEPGEQV